MSKIFQTVAGPRIKRAAFDLSHERKLTGKMGYLLPVLAEECVPGDKFHIQSEVMMRVAPMIAPMFHRVNTYVHYFFVPNRIIWDDWEKFITGDLETVVPSVTVPNGSIDVGSVYDYFGIPTHLTTGTQTFNALPFRAYYKIWNEYYRDQDLQSELVITNPSFTLQKRAWEKDYFTSARPWAQKGDPVSMPIYGEFSPTYKTVSRAQQYGVGGVQGDLQSAADGDIWSGSSATEVYIDNLDNPQTVDGSFTINDFRTAYRLQRWLEKNARAGSRYVEHLLQHWGVRSSDARLDRPEFIGGGKQPLVISEVLNTMGSDASGTYALGDFAGHGLSVGNANKASKYCEEHGWIIGLLSVVPRTNYHQGMHRKFSRSLPTDYYFPEFANLGEQEILFKELYAQATSDDTTTFGYQSRYAEYKYGQSTIHGDFKDSMDFWHLSRDFASKPSLNGAFVTCTPSDRIFAVQDGSDHLWIQMFNKIIAKRPMPYHSNPSL